MLKSILVTTMYTPEFFIGDEGWRELVARIDEFDQRAAGWLSAQAPARRVEALAGLLQTNRKKIDFLVGMVRELENLPGPVQSPAVTGRRLPIE